MELAISILSHKTFCWSTVATPAGASLLEVQLCRYCRTGTAEWVVLTPKSAIVRPSVGSGDGSDHKNIFNLNLTSAFGSRIADRGSRASPYRLYTAMMRPLLLPKELRGCSCGIDPRDWHDTT
eukprot:scaffold193405_cov72-Attheya_sp.AAC.1